MAQLRHNQGQENQRSQARPPLFRSTEQPQQALFFERQDVRLHGARWARADGSTVIKGAKEVEEGSAAVAEPSRPGKKEAASALIAVATEEATAVGGNSDAAAEDKADVESCMFTQIKFRPQMHNRSYGQR